MGTTNYPSSLDTFATTSPTNLGDDDAQARNHAERHDDMGAAMNAVQTELGTDPAGTHATVKNRLAAMHRGFIPGSGRYFASHSAQTSYSSAFGLNWLHFMPLFVPSQVSVVALTIYVSTAEASAVWRLGIYTNDPATDMPSSLVVDAGTVDCSSTGQKEATFTAETLDAGLYWMAGVPQTVSTNCRVYQVNPYGLRIPSDTYGAQGSEYGWRQSSVSGALPSTVGTIYTNPYIPSIVPRVAT